MTLSLKSMRLVSIFEDGLYDTIWIMWNMNEYDGFCLAARLGGFLTLDICGSG